jgi:hypothetical protein
MVPPRLPTGIVHALLHDHPAAIVGDDEAVQVEIKPVLDGCTVNLGDKAARLSKPCPVDPDPFSNG